MSAQTIADLPIPDGYERIDFTDDSFSGWLQNLPIKSDLSIKTYDGGIVAPGRYSRFAVVNVPLLFPDDLEQCADFCMRFWAEYHRQTGRLQELYLFNYGGAKQYFSASGLRYESFLRRAFAYSNSHSLKTGCAAIGEGGPVRLIPGDMFVQNDHGGIGHVSMVMDLCVNSRGEELYLIGFSFMPAQEFHIEQAPVRGGYGTGGWFSYDGYVRYLRQYFPYGEPVMRRFSLE